MATEAFKAAHLEADGRVSSLRRSLYTPPGVGTFTRSVLPQTGRGVCLARVFVFDVERLIPFLYLRNKPFAGPQINLAKLSKALSPPFQRVQIVGELLLYSLTRSAVVEMENENVNKGVPWR